MLNSESLVPPTNGQKIEHSLKSHSLIGALVIILLLVGLGGWLAFASIAGAVIASGTVVIEHNIKRVQHKEGGIIGKRSEERRVGKEC